MSGAVRDAVIASLFTVGLSDLFFIAFTIPNALRVLFGEGATAGAVVPIYQTIRQRDGEAASKQWLRRVFGVWIPMLALVSGLGVLSAPYWVQVYAPGLVSHPDRFETTVSLTRYVFPFIFFMGIYGLVMGVLNAHNRFFLAALAPILTNLALIVVPWLLSAKYSIYSLAFGALIGGALQMLVLLIPMQRERLLAWPKWDLGDPNVRALNRRMTPMFFGAGVYQVNIMFSRLFASFLPVGAQSYLYYGQRVVEIPQGLFALAISTASLPTLARHFANYKWDDAEKEHTKAQRWTLFLAIPCAFALMALAYPTASVLFGRGAFKAYHVEQTARSLFWQGAAVIPIASVRAAVPWFHAQGDTFSPARASVFNVIVFCVVAFLLTQGGVAHWGHAGIAMAIGAGALVQWAMLIRSKARDRDSYIVSGNEWQPKLKYGLKLALCSLAAGAVSYAVASRFRWMSNRISMDFEIFRAGMFLSVALLYSAIYVSGCMVLRIDEVFSVLKKLKRIFGQ